jgi:hypothetical protein
MADAASESDQRDESRVPVRLYSAFPLPAAVSASTLPGCHRMEMDRVEARAGTFTCRTHYASPLRPSTMVRAYLQIMPRDKRKAALHERFRSFVW